MLPAALVPVAAQVGGQAGDGDEVEGPGRDVLVAARADVGLGGLVGLDEAGVAVVVEAGRRGSPEHGPGHEQGHATITAPTTMAMSAAETLWGRKGLRPMTTEYRPGRGRSRRYSPRRDPTPPPPPGRPGAAAWPWSSPPAAGIPNRPVAAGSSHGQSVYEDNCARCHGPDGEGGVGPQLGDGAVGRELPDIEDQRVVIHDGRNGMPAWEGTLSPGGDRRRRGVRARRARPLAVPVRPPS